METYHAQPSPNAVVVFNTRPQTDPRGPLKPSLVLIMRSDEVRGILTDLVRRALTVA